MNNTIGENKTILGIALLTLFMAMLFRLLNSMLFMESSTLLYLISAESTVLVFFIIMTLKKWHGTFFKITTIFVIMYSLYMMGQLFLNAFGLLHDPILSGKFQISKVIEAVIDVHIYLAFFLMGISLAPKYKKKNVFRPDRYGVKVGYWVIAFSLPFELAVTIMKVTISLTYGYASLYQDVAYDAIPSFAKILSYFFLPGVFFLLFCAPRKSTHEKVALMLMAYHCIAYLIMGYRAATITPILLLLYTLRVKNQEMSRTSRQSKKTVALLVVIAAILVLVVFPYVGENRNNGDSDTKEITFAELVESNPVFETVNEMGKSLQTLVYTEELVPSSYPYRYGYTYLMNLTTVIPNLFWDKHPAEVYGSLGRWLTKIVDYDFWEFGGALGYSCVAEAYINFGYPGIVIIAFLLGYILIRIENKVDSRNSPMYYAALCVVAINLTSYARGEFADVVRSIFWYMLIPLLMYKFIKPQNIRV